MSMELRNNFKRNKNKFTPEMASFIRNNPNYTIKQLCKKFNLSYDKMYYNCQKYNLPYKKEETSVDKFLKTL